jgi:adenine/guanine/hypoxanthine permease
MTRYGWARRGDVNAFFGLMLDNVAVMVLLVGSISSLTPPEQQQGAYSFSRDFVLTRMLPGTALGVLIGDLVYTWMAFRLARRSGRDDVTAMPLGLDTPSTIGVAFLVLLPTLGQEVARLRGDRPHPTAAEHEAAMLFAWHVGVVVLLLVGLFKVACAPLGNAVRRWVPRAGLLGSLAAVALVLIAFLPLLFDVAAVPLVGVLALAVILVTLVAHRALPGRLPGALAAVLLGAAVYWACSGLDAAFGWSLVPPLEPAGPWQAWRPSALLPWAGNAEVDWWARVWLGALAKLPLALPFALATIVGGIDCTESAAAAGDEYDTRTILLTEGVASVIAAGLGGVIQTTPYIGQPAYKAMGGRAAYTLATALFIGAVGLFGWFTLLFALLPRAAMFPILVYVGLEITAQSFRATPERHYPALALAALPALAYLVTVPLAETLGVKPEPRSLLLVQTLRCLANGFIITSLLWAAALAALLDSQPARSAGYLLVAAACALAGVIHSPLPNGAVDLPWNVLAQVPPEFADAVRAQTPYHWAAAYGLAALLLLGLSLLPRGAGKSIEEASQAGSRKGD